MLGNSISQLRQFPYKAPFNSRIYWKYCGTALQLWSTAGSVWDIFTQILSKVELLEMLGNGSVILFHKHICAYCHTVPNFKKWTTDKIKPGTHSQIKNKKSKERNKILI